jgi:hypothetical protein
MLVSALLFTLFRIAPLGAAIDSENPQQLPAEPAEESSASSMVRPDALSVPLDRPRRTAIYWVVGVGTPVGVSGFEAVRRLGHRFEIAAGFGGGFAALVSEPHPGFGHVAQWAAMPRLRFGNDEGAFTIGAGVSGGNYADLPLCFDDPCSATQPVSYVLWNNFEIAGERWGPHGLALRAFAGYAHGWCVSSSCVTALEDIPYFGFGIGYAF